MEKKMEKLKGTDKDPNAKRGPGGVIPIGSDEIAAEKKLAEEKKELEDAKAKEKEDKGDKMTDCVDCERKDRLKKSKIVKAVSE